MADSPFPGAIPRASGGGGRKQNFVAYIFLIFTFLSIIFWLQQQLDFNLSLDLGMPVPDIVNISETFDNLINTGGLNQEGNQFIGLTILYGWAWLLHPALCFLVNIVLMAWATNLYNNFFIRKLGAPSWSILGVLGNPYLALAMIGPNKEIPLLLLTLIFFRAIIERRSGWFLIGVATCLAVFVFREGYGIYLGIILIILLIPKVSSRALVILTFIICFATSVSFGLLDSIFPFILGKNKDIFEMLDGGSLAVGAFASILGLDPSTALGGGVLFFLRAIYNILTMALFPVLQNTIGIHWIGLAYWLFGLMVLICMSSCIVTLVSMKPLRSPVLVAAALSIGTWFVISVSLFVQPRYLMPIFPLAIFVLACSPPRTRTRSILVPLIFTGLVIFTYSLLDRVPALADPDSFDMPSYILN